MPHVDSDQLANFLMRSGHMAVQMPPSWDGAGISQPIGNQYGFFGRMMPGKGVLLATDLKNLGIKGPLPYVYDRSPFMRLTDKWRRRKVSERARSAMAEHHIDWSDDNLDQLIAQRRAIASMALSALSGMPAAAITTYDGIIAARAASTGAPLDLNSLYKPSVTTVASQWHSLGMLAGTPPAMTITATPGAVMTNANVGSWGLGWPVTSSTTTRYLLSFGYAAAQIINFAQVVDILEAVGTVALGSSGTTTFTSPPALTRYTTGAGVMMIWEVTTVFGGTAATLQMTYTDQAGTTNQTTAAIGVRSTAAIVSMLQPSVVGSLANNIPFIPLASGDYGVRAYTNVIMAGTAMGSGAGNLYLYYPLMWVPGIAASMWTERDSTIQIDGLTPLAQDTSFVPGCLNVFVQTNTTSTGIINAAMRSCVG